MSKTVDERVVEMRFDNAKFEKNVSTSMSTLDKLKNSLKLTEASKGFENINKASNNVSFANISSGVEFLEKRFSVMGIVGMRVIENITDKMMLLAGQTIGFLKNSIVRGGISRAMNLENAHFQLQGLLKDEEQVSAVMKNVSDSVDGTAYSLDAAATVASQLAASGMRAGDQMFSSLRAVAGVAAMTNSSYESIGRIFTQVAGQGRLMGNDLLQLSSRGMNAAATIAEYLGKTETEVREMVSKGQISFEIFANAMDSAFGEHAKKANETFTGAMSNVKSALARIGAEFVSPLVEQNGPLVELFNALRERINDVKKSLVDSGVPSKFTGFVSNMAKSLTNFLKTLGSGSQWGLFESKLKEVGISSDDFSNKFKEVAKEHGIAIDDIIEEQGSLTKALLNGQIPKASEIIVDTIKKFIGASNEAVASTEKITGSLEEFQKIVTSVIRGEFGNGVDRVNALTEAGYEYAVVQDLVNKIWERNGQNWSDCTITADMLAESIANMSKEELKSIGYTEEQADAIKKLAEEAKKTGTPINELIENLSKPSKGQLFMESISNALQAIKQRFVAVKEAFTEIFTSEKMSKGLYGFLKGLRDFTKGLVLSEEKADRLKSTFKGVFAIFDMLASIISGVLRVGLNIFNAILGKTRGGVLEVTGSVGDAIVAFHDWFFENDIVGKSIEKITNFITPLIAKIKEWIKAFKELPFVKKILDKISSAFNSFKDDPTVILKGINKLGKALKSGVNKIKEWVDAFKNLPVVQKAIEKIQEAFSKLSSIFGDSFGNIVDWFKGLKDAESIPEYLIEGFKNGLGEKVSSVLEKIKEFAKSILAKFREVLGIHSPSTETYSDGKNFGQGFIDGLKSLISNILGIVNELGTKIIESIRNFNFGKAVSVAFGAGAFAVTFKSLSIAEDLVGAIKNVTSPMAAVNNLINDCNKSLQKNMNAKKWETYSNVILNIAKAIGIVAASIFALGKLDTNEIKQGGIAAGIIAAVMIALIAAMYAIDKKSKGMDKGAMKDMASNSINVIGLLLAMSGSLFLMSMAIKKLSKISPEQMEVAISGFSTIVLSMVGLLLAFALVSKYGDSAGVNQCSTVMLKVSAALMIMTVAIKKLSKISSGGMEIAMQGLTAIVLSMVGLLLAFALITKYGNAKDIDECSNIFIKVSAAILIMAVAVKMLGGLSFPVLAQGALAIAAFGLIISFLIASTKRAGKDIDNIGDTILKIGITIALMAISVKIMGSLNETALKQGALAIAAFGLIISVLIAATKRAGKDIDNIGNTILGISVAFILMSLSVVLLSSINQTALKQGLIAIGVFGLIISVLIAVTRLAGKNLGNLAATMIGISAAILVMSLAVIALGFMDPGALAKGLICVTYLTGLMQGLIVVTLMAKGCANTLKFLTIAIVALVGSVVVLSFIKVESLWSAVGAISVLIGMFALLIGASQYATKSIASIVVMTLAVGLLAAMLYVLSGLEVESVIGTAASLSVLLLTMAIVCAVMALIPIQAAVMGALGLGAFILIMTGVIAAIGGLTKIPGFTELIQDGGATLALVGQAIGTFVGSIVNGFLVSATAGLGEVGKNLSEFIVNAMPFIMGVKMVDGAFLFGVTALTAGIIALTIAEFISGIASILTFGGSLASLGADLGAFMTNALPFVIGSMLVKPEAMEGVRTMAQAIMILSAANMIDGFANLIPFGGSLAFLWAKLSAFMINATPFIMLSSLIKPEIMQGVKAMAEAILILTGAELLDGIASFFGGDDNFEEFGKKISNFGSAMAEFEEATKDLDSGVVQNAANAGKAVAEMADAIPNEGGLLGKIMGENDMGKFSENIVSFADAIVQFSAKVDGAVKLDQVQNAADAGKAIIEMAKEIPNDGGVVGFFAGENNLGDFSSNIVTFADAIALFSFTVDSAVNLDQVKNACDAGTEIIEMAKEIPNDGGVVGFFAGNNDLGDFSDNIITFGDAIAQFSSKVSENGINVESIKEAADGGIAIIGMAKEAGDADDLQSNLKDFGKALESFGDSIVDLDTDKLSSAGKAFANIADMAKKVSGVKANAMKEFSKSLSSISKTDVDNFVAAFEDATPKSTDAIKNMLGGMLSAARDKIQDFKKVADDIADKFATAIKNGTTVTKQAFSNLLTSTLGALDDKLRDFKTAGKSVVEGFADGISENSYLAEAEAKTMADDAYKAAKGELEVNSPSKIFRRLAYSVPEGFAMGIAKMSYMAEDSAADMANNAINGTKNAISKIADVINSDVDTQPTIRPILDLSNVTSGAGRINRMLNITPSVGVISNVRSINSMMNELQNGSNNRVVSAIDKLSKKLGNTSSNTYNINGITYEEGSDVSDAFKTIIRAAKIERRT